MSEALEILKELSAIPGVSGDESLVREEIISQIKGFCDYRVDALGNLICDYKGEYHTKKKLMLCAHMDEIGFIVTGVDNSGLLWFSAVGGVDSRVVLGKSVLIGPEKIYGVIGAKATHQLKEKEKSEPIPINKLYIDIGANDKDDALKYVSPGDTAVFSSDFTRLSGGKIMGRAFDDRAGCAILISIIRSRPKYDCSFVFTVCEEVGCIGAMPAGYAVSPDICVVTDATTASDIAGVEPKMTVCSLKKGPVISFMDKGAIYDRDLYKLAVKISEAENIQYQIKSGVFGGNDARSIQTAKSGSKVIAVSLPCRYIHTGRCVLDTSDIESTEKLLDKLISRICEDA